MNSDFMSSSRPASLIPVKELLSNEREALTKLGLALDQHEYVATDLASRLDKNPGLDANQVNSLALDEWRDEDELSTLHPDIAASLRETLGQETIKSRPLNEIVQDLDEQPDAPKEKTAQDPTKQDQESTEEALAQVVSSLSELRKREREAYRKRVSEEDRNALLEEAMTGKQFEKIFKLLNGKLIICLSTITAEQSDDISKYCSKQVNVVGSMTTDSYQMMRAKIKAAVRLKYVVSNGNFMYQREEGKAVEDIQSQVYKTIANSEMFRLMLANCDKEFNMILDCIMEEMTRDVFINPALEGIG
jgi:hypothetical protein